jgi:SAM-dependent methyltransferase
LPLRRSRAPDRGGSLSVFRLFHPDGPSFWELAQQALSSTERGYDLLAPKFDVTPFRTPDGILGPAARFLREEPPKRALDLCCGTGAMLEALRPLAPELTVGLDFSRGMLRVARAREPRLVRADALAPPFVGCFDLVTCFSSLGHFLPSQQEAFVAAVSRCLVPGGRFVFATGRMPFLGSSRYWISRGFNAAMHLRNAVWRPPFIMYYLTFLLPEASDLLERNGFRVRVVEGAFEPPFEPYQLVEGRKIGGQGSRG